MNRGLQPLVAKGIKASVRAREAVAPDPAVDVLSGRPVRHAEHVPLAERPVSHSRPPSDLAAGARGPSDRRRATSSAQGRRPVGAPATVTLTVGTPPAVLPGYPNPADVRAGVVYGPNGEYVGTLVV